MNPRLKKFLVIGGYILLFAAAIGAWILLGYLVSIVHPFLFAGTPSQQIEELVFNILGLVLLAVFYGIYQLCSIFTEKIISSHQSFKDKNGGNNVFSEVYNDPTIGLKDKILFFSIHLIYWIQLPFLYCTSKISTINKLLQGLRDEGLSLPL